MSFQAVKGVKDTLPGETEVWRRLEDAAREVFRVFGFREIRVPIFEYTEVFTRSIGDATDIVEKEMYTFEDGSGRKITLRPEGTASVVRAYVEHSLYAQAPVSKLWYMGPMFRRERPQAGRYRQFHQIGAELFGADTPESDVDLLVMIDLLFRRLGITQITLNVNSLGCPQCRPGYRDVLTEFLRKRIDALCPDCRRRYTANPLRALDCKSNHCKEATGDAPSILDCLCGNCRTHFDAVKEGLALHDVPYLVNPRLVRGLDYYTRTAFEFIATGIGAQNAVAAGGRYDRLVEETGGPSTPGIGFALGVERVVALMRQEEQAAKTDIFFALMGDASRKAALPVIHALRVKGKSIESDYAGASLKSQMKKADKCGASITVILGDQELERGEAMVRDMATKEQKAVLIARLVESLTREES